ncbi:MAG: DUF494 domain-containing protein [Gammaproteobacteria bacterium]|nr:DUF494 domain-containing protein [Gammaproteobacteria bacterium]NIR81787.1 DUF494 domain-containing protein [Gammaproteobacteria bacterium]NIR88619.1 DUF494 domain-containing protein [Gammaproteobacteria bacterium]NIU02895.1 DUF494 domain-containing protein [Gammaproteobacteria bacterium]NIV50416.1 DUF494 family protein [Gammaproteobacteria bacterium]
MKETVLDVLMYLFEHYPDVDMDVDSDEALVRRELIEAGFRDADISKAFAWLEGLTTEYSPVGQAAREGSAIRVFSAEEMRRLDVECRGFLVFLEQAGVLDARTRELIIDQVMGLETDSVDLEQLKWVALMVLLNQPGNESVAAWVEDFVFDTSGQRLH